MKSLFTSTLILFTLIAFAQTERNVIVEHFTNTNCSVCGSRNPGLHSNLANDNPEVIHISYHPSRPYNDCKLNNHNGVENDDRTKYYGIFGSTPQIVIQGETKPRANFSNANLFDEYKGVNSDYTSKTTYEIGADSMYVQVVLNSENTTDWSNLNIIVMAVEDTVNYKGRNSERVHYNVFRRSFNGVEGVKIDNLIELGDSVVFFYSLPIHQDWDVDQMSTITIIQSNIDKSIENAERGKVGTVQRPVGLSEKRTDVSIYPTLVNNTINIGPSDFDTYDVIGIDGKIVQSGNIKPQLQLESLQKGFYFLRLKNSNTAFDTKFIKK